MKKLEGPRMKYSGYYYQIINGTWLFLWRHLNFNEYKKWITDGIDWLKDYEYDRVEEWDTLDNNYINPNQHISSEINQLISLIRNRYSWLAYYANDVIPSKNEKVINRLVKKVNSEPEKINDLIRLGIYRLNSHQFRTTHENFHRWLREISDLLQLNSPDSGLSAEWYSLPTMTSFYNDTLVGGGVNELSKAIKERILWLGNLFNLNVYNHLSEFENFINNEFEFNNFAIEDLLFKPKYIKWDKPLYQLANKLALEATQKDEQIKWYMKQNAKFYVDKKCNAYL